MPERSSKNKAAVALGRRGGRVGGARRAAVLSPERRSRIAAEAARARWARVRGDEPEPAAERDASRTRERLLYAALREFSAHGYAGGRLERIARRAGVDKRMIPYYFGNKAALFRELADRFYAELESISGSLADSLEATQSAMARSADWMRIAAWQMLQTSSRAAPPPARRALWSRAVESLRDEQRRGAIRDELDPAQLQLSIVALVMFPFILPQMAQLITGRRPNDPRFLEDRAAALRALAALLAPE
jgi:AcrR family transcriptional regulator